MTTFKGKAVRIAAAALAGWMVCALALGASQAGDTAQATPSEKTVNTSGRLEEVVVTAQKRSESAQSTPLALQVVSGDDIANRGVDQPQDLEKLVPGLKMSNAATTQIYIRGVGENSGTSLGQSAVAVSSDGVYIGRVTAVNGNFFDLERVEVLKGPQGTLYGRNASGGAVNIISKKPTHEFGGNVQAELGDFNLRRINGAINIPVSDDFALRFALYDSKRNGYLTDGREDEDIQAGRVHALWTPNQDVSVLFTIDGSKVGGIGDGEAFIGKGLTGARQSTTAETLHQLALVDTTNGTVPIPLLAPQYRDFKNSSARVQLDWNLGFATLTVLPGYRKQTFSYVSTEMNGSNESHGSSDQFSGEVRLSHQTSKLKWSTGLYYFKEDVDFTSHGQYVFFEVAPFHVYSTVNNYFQAPVFGTKSTALFGEATYSFTDRFRGIFGARYTDEKRNVDLRTQWYGEQYNVPGFSTTAVNPLTGLPTNLYTYNNLADLKFGSTTGKVGFEFDVAPESLLYLTVASGFKSGGFSLSPPPQATFQPEKLTAYTLGWKNRLLDNRVQLNGEAFYWDYTNQQISHQAPDINGAQGFLTENAGKTKIYGAEADGLWAPSDKDRIGLQVQYLRATFTKFFVVTGFPGGGDGCTYAPSGSVFTKDCTGLDAPYAPQWTGTGGYSHTFNAGSGHVVFNANAQFSSKQQTDVTSDTRFTVPGYALYDADIGYESAKKSWGVTGYVRNLTNRIVYNDNIQKVDFAKDTDFQTSLIPADLSLKAGVLPPRTYGVRFDVRF
jgi:iron complex outermembrane recepter protein